MKSYSENGDLEPEAFISACEIKNSGGKKKNTNTILKQAFSDLELIEEGRIAVSVCCLL